MTTIAARRMKPEARAVLAAAYQFHLGSPAFFRPKDVGGTATNRCAGHLKALITRGLVEREDAAPGGMRETKLWKYRITQAGIEEAAL